MTCGICHPEAFRENGNRVYVCAVSSRPGSAETDARRLYYLGAEYVFTDEPKGNVRNRPGLRIIRKVLRPGDWLMRSRWA